MRRPLYVFQRLASDIVGLISRFINAIVFHGSTAQTLSARAHVESKSGRWLKRRRFINALFFWQDDHCAGDWALQVERALRTLEINEALSSARAQMNKADPGHC